MYKPEPQRRSSVVRDIYLYTNIGSWNNEKPDATIRGEIREKHDNFIEIYDENGFNQIIMLDKLFAVVYQ